MNWILLTVGVYRLYREKCSNLSEESYIPLHTVWEIHLDFRIKHLNDIIHHLTSDLIASITRSLASCELISLLKDLKGPKPAKQNKKDIIFAFNQKKKNDLWWRKSHVLTWETWEQYGGPQSIFHGERDHCSICHVWLGYQRSPEPLLWWWAHPGRT